MLVVHEKRQKGPILESNVDSKCLTMCSLIKPIYLLSNSIFNYFFNLNIYPYLI
jgi:hypothetical protein